MAASVRVLPNPEIPRSHRSTRSYWSLVQSEDSHALYHRQSGDVFGRIVKLPQKEGT
jgi:hypothetical protein